MKVLMVCSGGMSSAIVVKAIKQEAERQNFPLEIKAIGTMEFEDEIAKGELDLVIVAPQVKHRFETFKKQAEGYNLPIELIAPMGYTPIGAPKTLEQIKKHKK